MAVNTEGRRLPVVPSQDGTAKGGVDESHLPYEHPLYKTMLSVPGLSVATGAVDAILEWGLLNSIWIFPMATSCCGIELMSAAASRVDLDRMGTILRATPRQADVMVIAGTITVKMAPRVKALWEQMPEPKWAIAMGSCAISGDFYRNLYAVVPGIDTVIPVDVYIPGCPPNPEALMHGLLRLKEKVLLQRAGKLPPKEFNPAMIANTTPSIARYCDPARDAGLNDAQIEAAIEVSLSDRSDEDFPELEAEEPAPLVADEHPPELAALFAEHGVTETPKDAAPLVPIDKHWELARRLRAAGYRSLTYVVATHWVAKTGAKASPERFEVAYGLRTIGKGSKVASWRIALNPGESAPSLVGLFAGADWQEREQFDLVGVRFEGHPDLRRIMMPENYPGHPLRRDFASDTACPPWR